MNSELEEVITEYYEETNEENWYRCRECGHKVHARPDDYSDLAYHEVAEHPER